MASVPADDRQAEHEPGVTPLELFFDLVVVFAITQVTSFLSRSPTWGGLLRALLLLGMLWWAWSAYAWPTNTLDPEEGAVRLVMLGCSPWRAGCRPSRPSGSLRPSACP